MAVHFERLEVGNTPIPVAPAGDYNRAMITVEGDPIRFRTDGGAPDAITGHLTSSIIRLDGRGELSDCRVVSTGSSVLQITCDKRSTTSR